MIKLKSLILEELFKVGYSPDEKHPSMPVNWNASDVQILDVWSEKSIKDVLSLPANFVAIYRAVLEVSDLDYHLAEEDPDIYDPELGDQFDWSEFKMRLGGFPPVLVIREENGNLKVADGNHRVKWAEESGYVTIGAWVVDKLIQKEINNKKKE